MAQVPCRGFKASSSSRGCGPDAGSESRRRVNRMHVSSFESFAVMPGLCRFLSVTMHMIMTVYVAMHACNAMQMCLIRNGNELGTRREYTRTVVTGYRAGGQTCPVSVVSKGPVRRRPLQSQRYSCTWSGDRTACSNGGMVPSPCMPVCQWRSTHASPEVQVAEQ